MRVLRLTAILVSLAGLRPGLAADAPAANSARLPVTIAPDDGRIRYVGRFVHADGKAQAAWPGSSILVRFTGTAVNALLTDTARGDANKEAGLNTDYVNAVVDGGEPLVLALKKGRNVYRVGDNLAEGEHTLLLFKRTESFVGTMSFHGLELAAGGRLTDMPPPTRRIEFIGDSITCGYGNEAPNERMHFNAATENNYLAYGAVVARHFGAEYMCIAWSGIGAWSSRGDTNNTMRTRYDRILPWSAKPTWDFSRWIPDVVFINLGTNDFAKEDPGENYVACYADLLKRVRSNYPDAWILCGLGPMMWGNQRTRNQQHIETAIERAAVGRIAFVDLGTQNREKNGLGADWHPSVKTHAEMAQTVIQAVQRHVGW